MFNYSHIAKCLTRAVKVFPCAYIKIRTEELIIEPVNNIYFILGNIENPVDFDCKMIAYLSRAAHKGLTKKWHEYFLKGLNSYFNQNWTSEDISIIYTYLGNDCNRNLCKIFLCSNFDINLLKKRSK
jgi:hypothetical protein